MRVAGLGMAMGFSARTIVVSGLAALVGLSGCSTLPRAGPGPRDIDKQAAAKVGNAERKVGLNYVLVDLSKDLLPFFKVPARASIRDGFGGGRGPAPQTVLGVGDIVQISIFESASGGLFIPSDAGSRPGNFINLPVQTIDGSGTISVPYAGRVRAAGRTTESVQSEVQNLLANRAIEPQVLVSIVENRSRQVSVLGDVTAPAKLDISPAGERILDVIARAGGLSTPGIETYVTLQRRGREGTVLFSRLVENSVENIFVAPGDTIYVNRERRTYLAFGASGLNGRIDFEESDLTLGEALGKAGGLLDGRADPAQVFLYRDVERSVLSGMGLDVSRYAGGKVPVIFRANLRDPATFFVMQQMPMVDKDILYVSNSGSTEVEKFVGIVSQVTGGVAAPAVDAASVRNAF